jgi:hypothetical protein
MGEIKIVGNVFKIAVRELLNPIQRPRTTFTVSLWHSNTVDSY